MNIELKIIVPVDAEDLVIQMGETRVREILKKRIESVLLEIQDTLYLDIHHVGKTPVAVGDLRVET